jgi:hypothetical protein
VVAQRQVKRKEDEIRGGLVNERCQQADSLINLWCARGTGLSPKMPRMPVNSGLHRSSVWGYTPRYNTQRGVSYFSFSTAKEENKMKGKL